MKMSSEREAMGRSAEADDSVNSSKSDESTPEKNSKSKQTKSTRKRKRRHSSTDEEELETSIDAKLKQSAKRNNLTPQNVKNILQKVVRNDHVLAIVKLKEEELERREQAMKDAKFLSDTSADSSKFMDNDEADSESAVPKLTRAKAKALNQFPLPVVPIKHSKPDSDVVALIREELHSDDDDEEYQPGEDDIESDDDLNTTTSDIDSQPATPSSQADACEELSHATYTQDGLFKIPRARTDSTASQSEQEYIIAQRTRSKISLAETPIETIQSTFWAPDAPLDMYQMEGDGDPNWIQFLNNFAMPLTSEIEKDEELDPDYNPVLVDSHPEDREEFQHVMVSKKEVNDLWNEVYKSIDIDSLDLRDLTDALTLDSNTPKQMTDQVQNLDESLITPVKETEEPLTTADASKIPTQPTCSVPAISPISSSSNINYFNPSIISTPAKSGHDCNVSQSQQQNLSGDSFNSTLLSINESTATQYSYAYPYPMNANSFSQIESKSPILIPIMTCVTSIAGVSGVPVNNHQLPSSAMIMPSQSTITTLTSAMPSTVISSIQSNDNSQPLYLRRQIEAGPTPKRPGSRAKRSRFKSAIYNELENFNPNNFQPKVSERMYYFSAPNVHIYHPDERGFTTEQRNILDTQLRMHVQLATQSYMQTYAHPEYYAEAPKVLRFLTELDEHQAKPIYNLKPALELISKWEMELAQNTKDNAELVAFQRNEMEKWNKNKSYTMKFHERILDVMSKSKVFLYPDLLPAIPLRFPSKTSKPFEYVPGEDFWLASLLERFYDDLNERNKRLKLAKPVTLMDVCGQISAHIGYIRQKKSIYDYVRFRKQNDSINPIKFYFKHKRAPPIRHRYEIFNPDLVLEPAKQPLVVLPPQWAQYIQKLIGFNYDELLNKSNVSSATQNRRTSEKSVCIGPREIVKPHTQVNTIESKLGVQQFPEHVNPVIKVKILFESNEPNPHENQRTDCKIEYETGYCDASKCDISENESLLKGQTLLTSYFHRIQKIPNDLSECNLEIDSDIDIENSNHLIISENDKTDQNCLISCARQIRRKYNWLKKCKYLIRRRIVEFLVQLIRKTRRKFSPRWHQFQNKDVQFVYQCLISYHCWTTALVEQSQKQVRKKHTTKALKITTEAIIIERRVQKLLNATNMKETIEDNSPTTHNSDISVKRPPKNQRTTDTSRLLLLTENAQETAEKDYLFAQRFMDRVEEIFISGNKHHKFSQFLDILRNFSENQHHQTGADLYLILEKFLLPDSPELIELFLYFLTPNDAVEINKSMEHFLKVNSTKFLNKLNTFFQKQPAQIRKVLTCLKELSEESDVTVERIRTRILPLLKGNQLLIDWFLQCIGPDKCENSKDEYETLMLRKGNESFDDDQFEYIPQGEIVADPQDNPCHIRYMNGRLFYGNRFPLPAKLSFSAVPYSAPTIDTAEADREFQMASGDKTLQYRCVHNIKEFADNKIRDKHHSDLEQVGNSAPVEEAENSDDEHHCLATLDKSEEKNSFDEEIDASNVSVNEHVLCDNTLLKAHSIRLNPSLHASVVHSNAEFLNKLKPLEQLSAEANKELRISPKKQAAAKCSINAQTKTAQVRKTNSPNAKKMPTIGCKSPKKTASPIASAADNVENACSPQMAQESNAIQTAKKLKRFLEIDEPTASTSSQPDDVVAVDEAAKRSNFEMSSTKMKSQKSHMLLKPIKKQKRAHEYQVSADEEEKTEEIAKKGEVKVHSECDGQKELEKDNAPEIQWTKEEDRLLLEQIYAGLNSKRQYIAEFAHRFPNKSQEHIRNRIDFLIDFLTKLQNKK